MLGVMRQRRSIFCVFVPSRKRSARWASVSSTQNLPRQRHHARRPWFASSRQLLMPLPSPHYVPVLLLHAARPATSAILDRCGPTLDRQRTSAAGPSCSIHFGSLITTVKQIFQKAMCKIASLVQIDVKREQVSATATMQNMCSHDHDAPQGRM